VSANAQYGWGVIGCGRMVEKRMAPALVAADDVSTIAFCSRDAERAKQFAGQFGNGNAYADIDSLLTDDQIDIIYIALPHTLHAKTAIQCLNAGKHVLVDKPAATHTKDIVSMVQTAAANDRKLRVLHQQRFHRGNQRLLEIVANGDLGRVHLVRLQIGMWMRGYSAWRFDPRLAGGGALMDLGPHALDLILTLLGTPVAVTARTTDLALHEKVEDFCAVTIEFADGRMAVADFSYSSHAYGGQIDVFGSEGSSVIRGSMQQAAEWSMMKRNGSDEGPWETSDDVGDCFGDAIAAMHGEIAGSVASEAYHYVNIGHVIDAAYESAATGQRISLGR